MKSKRRIKRYKRKTRRHRNKKGGAIISNYNAMSLDDSLNHFNELLNNKCRQTANDKQLYITVEKESDEYIKVCLNIIHHNQPVDESVQMLTRSKRMRPAYDTIHQCISSITLTMDSDDDSIIIDSKTLDEFQKRNLNSLLRALVILLAKKIAPSKQYIVSFPMNYLSAYSLITKFNGVPYNSSLNKRMNLDALKSVEDYKNYYVNAPVPDETFADDYIGPIDEIRVMLNYYNMNTAYDLFMQTLSKIACDILDL